MLAGCVFGLTSCGRLRGRTLTGAGSTLVAPIEDEWAAAWGSATGNSVSYNPVGSGTGEKDIAAGQVDFGASDAPLSVVSDRSQQPRPDPLGADGDRRELSPSPASASCT